MRVRVRARVKVRVGHLLVRLSVGVSERRLELLLARLAYRPRSEAHDIRMVRDELESRLMPCCLLARRCLRRSKRLD